MAEILNITSCGKGLPLVLIHGWGLNSGIWQPIEEKLKNNYQIITIDLPGYGLNKDHPISPYDLKEVAAIVQQSVAEPAVYLGWSLGGLVASQIALEQPSQVKALVTVCSSPCFVEKLSWPGIAPDVLNLFHRQLTEDTKATINNFLKIQAMGSPHIRHDVKMIRDLVMQYPMATKETLDESLALLETIDLRDYLSTLTMPFLRMYGRLDGLVPNKVYTQIEHLAPNSASHVFDKASHAPFISHESEFICTLRQWLDSL